MSMNLRTAICQLLGIEVPILSAGMGIAAGAELAAAVSNAGGCGVVGSQGRTSAGLHREIRRVREMTTLPFGVNVLTDIARPGLIETCIDAAPPVMVFFWGDAARWIPKAHGKDVKVVVQVGSAEEARRAAQAGADAIIAQGLEAGGHVRAAASLWVTLPLIADAVRPVPVLASGGIATGRGLAAALLLGAQGVSMGTRFLATDEAFAAREYKERIVGARSEDTVLLNLFDGGFAPDAPHRVIRNRIVEEWEAAGRPSVGQRPGEGTSVGTLSGGEQALKVPRYYSSLVTPAYQGDLEYAPLWCGESCSLVDEIRSAADVVRDTASEAADVLAHVCTGQ